MSHTRRLRISSLMKLIFIGMFLIVVSSCTNQSDRSLVHASQSDSGWELEKLFNQLSVMSDDKLQFKVQNILDTYTIPSVQACILKKENGMWQIAWSGAYGNRQAINPKIKADEDTIYAIGSITKLFTATAIMQLVEKGLINLDQPVNDLLPINANNPHYPDVPVTVRHLLNHRAGLDRSDMELCTQYINSSTDSPYGSGAYFEIGVPYPLQQAKDSSGTPKKDNSMEYALKKITNAKYTFWRDKEVSMPGSSHQYSNIGYQLLGYVIEEVINNNHESLYDWNADGDYWKSGQKKTWKDYVYKKILMPLGMINTRFYWVDYQTNNLAKEYNEVPFVENPDWVNATPEEKTNIPRFIRKKNPLQTASLYMRYSMGSSAGTMKSNAKDLAKFFIVFLNDGEGCLRNASGTFLKRVRILSKESIDEMQNVISTGTDGDYNASYAAYGFGWYKQIFGGRFWTSPWNPESDPNAMVNWGDPINPAPGSLRSIGIEPEDYTNGKGFAAYGHSGGVLGSLAMMFTIPSTNPDNDLGIIYLFNEGSVLTPESHDESQIQPLKFKHYSNFYDGGPDYVTPEEYANGMGALPHFILKNNELMYLFLQKAVSL